MVSKSVIIWVVSRLILIPQHIFYVNFLFPSSANKVHVTKQADPRREMLMKWKVEKETKRKIDQMKQSKSKPNFKVFKVNHDKASFLESDKKSKQVTDWIIL